MSSKVKRKVTVENTKDTDDQPRRPSVFERLGPGAMSAAAPPPERHRSADASVQKCRDFQKGSCLYGSTCRYKHESFPPATSSKRSSKTEKDSESKEGKRKSKSKREEPKEKRTDSASPKRKSSKRSSSRSGKSDHDGKIKSTVVVTKPSASNPGAPEPKKKADGNWEEDSEEWPIDAAQLDYKEELTLERRRQQLQRELELELQKERLMSENVTITKTVRVSFSENSSSTSSSSDSGSLSSSSGSSSSSSDEDSSSSSTSSSSSSSQLPQKKRVKKAAPVARPPPDPERARRPKRSARTPSAEGRKRRGKERKSPAASPRRRRGEGRSESGSRAKVKGPRTPSPVPISRKQRQWTQSSSADSRSAEVHHRSVRKGGGKRNKKKKDLARADRRKSGRGAMSPPPLSSPNRTALLPPGHSKKSKRDEKSRRRHRAASPPLLPTPRDKTPIEDRLRMHARDDLLPKRTDSRDRKRSKQSPPRKEVRRESPSPHKERYDSELLPPGRKVYEKEKTLDRRRASVSPPRRSKAEPLEKKRDASPHESRRDAYREPHTKSKRYVSPPEAKKGREEKSHPKDRSVEYEATAAWPADHRKGGTSSSGRRTPEPRGRQEIRSQPSSRPERSRERDQDRKKVKKRDHSVRSVEDSERSRLVVSPPRRSPSPIIGHHAAREIESLTGNRGHIYEADIPPVDPDYTYSYSTLHDPYLTERLLPPEYETEVLRGPPVYPAEVYPESRYRRGGKDPIDRYESRDVISSRDVLQHRDIISLTGRSEDYLSDLPIDERSYDDRWPRGRAREDWVDSYATIPAEPLPPHVAAALDEDRDRYGMPRRRRASPDWPRGSRLEDRDSLGHRSGSRGQGPPREGRSRSPPKGAGSSRGSWSDRGSRHDSRGGDNRQHDDTQKISEEKKRKTPPQDKRKPTNELSDDKRSVKKSHFMSSPVVKSKKKSEKDFNYELLIVQGNNQKISHEKKQETTSKDRNKLKEKFCDDKNSIKKKAPSVKKERHSRSSSPGVKSKEKKSDKGLTSELLKYQGDNQKISEEKKRRTSPQDKRKPTNESSDDKRSVKKLHFKSPPVVKSKKKSEKHLNSELLIAQGNGKKISDEKKQGTTSKDRSKLKEKSFDDKNSIKKKAASIKKEHHSRSSSPGVKSKEKKSDKGLTSELLKYQGDHQKISDDRKGRTSRKDRVKPKEESSDDKSTAKEKTAVKRPHSRSPSPAVKSKKRKNDRGLTSELMKYHGDNSEKAALLKKSRDESKATSSSRSQKPSKQGTVSPKPDSLPSEKSDAPSKSSSDGKSKEKDERKSRKFDDGAKGEDDFSDWSDDDDDLLTRDDDLLTYVESEGNSESTKSRHRTVDEPVDEGSSSSSRRKDKHSSRDTQHESKRGSSSRTSSKDRSNENVSHSKDNKSSDGKETDTQESFSMKEDTATDVDEYITAESVDYEPISDDDLDALIEEPDTSIITPAVEKEKSKIVDALDVDWSALMSDAKQPQFKAGSARQRFKPCHVLSRIGFSQALAGPELTQKIVEECQKQLDEENENGASESEGKREFVLEHPLAAFHASITQNKRERADLFSKVGPNRRALCARRDLQIRNLLCKPINKFAAPSTGTYTPQYTVVDKELYKQSLELLKLKKPPEAQPQTVDVC